MSFHYDDKRLGQKGPQNLNHITYIARFISPFPRWRQTNENKIIFIYFVNLFQVFTTGFDLFTDYRHETLNINVLLDPETFIGKCLGIRHCRTPRPWVSGSGTGPRDTSFPEILLLLSNLLICTYLYNFHIDSENGLQAQ